jgi:hypothetical protein
MYIRIYRFGYVFIDILIYVYIYSYLDTYMYAYMYLYIGIYLDTSKDDPSGIFLEKGPELAVVADPRV